MVQQRRNNVNYKWFRIKHQSAESTIASFYQGIPHKKAAAEFKKISHNSKFSLVNKFLMKGDLPRSNFFLLINDFDIENQGNR